MSIWRKSAVLTAGVMLSFSLAGFNSANADWTEPNGGADVDSDQLLTTAVPTQLWCTWYVNGVGSISLNPPLIDMDGDDPIYAEYEGAEMLLSVMQKQEILLAGWTETGTPTVADRFDGDDQFDCDWYLNGMGVSAIVSSDDTPGFSASTSYGGKDLEMGWSLTDSPLVATYEPDISFGDDSCNGWDSVSQSIIFNGDRPFPGSPINRPSSGISTANYCAFLALYEVRMPGGMTPTFPGQSYTYTGPTLTTRFTFLLD